MSFCFSFLKLVKEEKYRIKGSGKDVPFELRISLSPLQGIK